MNAAPNANTARDFFDVLRSRRSIRAFLERPIEEQKLHQILEATNRAPAAGNIQAYEVVLVRDNEIKTKLARAALEQAFIAEAPVLLPIGYPAESPEPAPRRRLKELVHEVAASG